VVSGAHFAAAIGGTSKQQRVFVCRTALIVASTKLSCVKSR
jgi:hypothetical protein